MKAEISNLNDLMASDIKELEKALVDAYSAKLLNSYDNKFYTSLASRCLKGMKLTDRQVDCLRRKNKWGQMGISKYTKDLVALRGKDEYSPPTLPAHTSDDNAPSKKQGLSETKQHPQAPSDHHKSSEPQKSSSLKKSKSISDYSKSEAGAPGSVDKGTYHPIRGDMKLPYGKSSAPESSKLEAKHNIIESKNLDGLPDQSVETVRVESEKKEAETDNKLIEVEVIEYEWESEEIRERKSYEQNLPDGLVSFNSIEQLNLFLCEVKIGWMMYKDKRTLIRDGVVVDYILGEHPDLNNLPPF